MNIRRLFSAVIFLNIACTNQSVSTEITDDNTDCYEDSELIEISEEFSIYSVTIIYPIECNWIADSVDYELEDLIAQGRTEAMPVLLQRRDFSDLENFEIFKNDRFFLTGSANNMESIIYFPFRENFLARGDDAIEMLSEAGCRVPVREHLYAISGDPSITTIYFRNGSWFSITCGS